LGASGHFAASRKEKIKEEARGLEKIVFIPSMITTTVQVIITMTKDQGSTTCICIEYLKYTSRQRESMHVYYFWENFVIIGAH